MIRETQLEAENWEGIITEMRGSEVMMNSVSLLRKRMTEIPISEGKR